MTQLYGFGPDRPSRQRALMQALEQCAAPRTVTINTAAALTPAVKGDRPAELFPLSHLKYDIQLYAAIPDTVLDPNEGIMVEGAHVLRFAPEVRVRHIPYDRPVSYEFIPIESLKARFEKTGASPDQGIGHLYDQFCSASRPHMVPEILVKPVLSVARVKRSGFYKDPEYPSVIRTVGVRSYVVCHPGEPAEFVSADEGHIRFQPG